MHGKLLSTEAAPTAYTVPLELSVGCPITAATALPGVGSREQPQEVSCDVLLSTDQDDDPACFSALCGQELTPTGTIVGEQARATTSPLTQGECYSVPRDQETQSGRMCLPYLRTHSPEYRHSPHVPRPQLHAIHLKIDGPHLDDLPQDFPLRLHSFLSGTLGMAPLHTAVGQGCVHLLVMLMELGVGAGMVGPGARRLRRCLAAGAGADTLPARLMAFMRGVLPEGVTLGHVTVRHDRKRYGPEGARTAPAGVGSGGADSRGASAGASGSGGGAASASGSACQHGLASGSAAAAAVLSTSSRAAGSGSEQRRLPPSQSSWPSSDVAGPSVTPAPVAVLSSGEEILLLLEAQRGRAAAMGLRFHQLASEEGLLGPLVSVGGEIQEQAYLQNEEVIEDLAARIGLQQLPPQMPSYAAWVGASNDQDADRDGGGGGGSSSSGHQRGGTGVLLQRRYCSGIEPATSASAFPVAVVAELGSDSVIAADEPGEEPGTARAAAGGVGVDVDVDVMRRMGAGMVSSAAPQHVASPRDVPIPNLGVLASASSGLPHTGGLLTLPTLYGDETVSSHETSGRLLIEAATQPCLGGYAMGARHDDQEGEMGAWRQYAPMAAMATAPVTLTPVSNAVRRPWCPAAVGPNDAMAHTHTVAAAAAAASAACRGGPSSVAVGPPAVAATRPTGALGGDADAAPMNTLTFASAAQRIIFTDHQLLPASASARRPSWNPLYELTLPHGPQGSRSHSQGSCGFVACNQGSGLSVQSLLGVGFEALEGLARTWMPPPPAGLAQLQSQPLGQAVQLFGPLVMPWPSASSPPAPPPPPVASDAAVATSTAAADAHGAKGVETAAVSVTAGAEVTPPPLTSAAGAAGAATTLRLQMRCPDVIARARARLGRRRGGAPGRRGDPWVRRSWTWDASEVESSGSWNLGDGASEDSMDRCDQHGGSGTGGSGGQVTGGGGRGVGASGGAPGHVSQLVAWTRGGLVPLMQLDDSAEGCTRATLQLPAPYDGPLQQSPPLPAATPLRQPRQQPLMQRAQQRPPSSQSTGMTIVGPSGEESSGCRLISGSRALAALISSSSSGVSPASAVPAPEAATPNTVAVPSVSSPLGSAAGPPASQLLYLAWRRGQSLGPPCPVLLLPAGMEDVVEELQAMQPPVLESSGDRSTGAQPGRLLAAYQAFIADLGIWLEGLRTLASFVAAGFPAAVEARGSSGDPDLGGGGGGDHVAWRVTGVPHGTTAVPRSPHPATPPRQTRGQGAAATAASTVDASSARSRSVGSTGVSRCVSDSTSGTDSDDRLVRLAEVVLSVGCDLLSHAVASGAVATARLVLGLLLTHGSKVPHVVALVGAATNTSSNTGAAAAVAGTATATAAATATPTPTVGTAAAATMTCIFRITAGGVGGGGAGDASGTIGPAVVTTAPAASESYSTGSGGSSAAVPPYTGAAVASGRLLAPQGRSGSGVVPPPPPSSDAQTRGVLLRWVVEECHRGSEGGQTLLHFAVMSRSLPMLRLVTETWPRELGLQLGDLNKLDRSGRAPAAYLQAPSMCGGGGANRGSSEFTNGASAMGSTEFFTAARLLLGRVGQGPHLDSGPHLAVAGGTLRAGTQAELDRNSSMDVVQRPLSHLQLAAGSHSSSVDAGPRPLLHLHSAAGSRTSSMDAVQRLSPHPHTIMGSRTSSMDAVQRPSPHPHTIMGSRNSSMDVVQRPLLHLHSAAGSRTSSMDAVQRLSPHPHTIMGSRNSSMDVVQRSLLHLHSAAGSRTSSMDAVPRLSPHPHTIMGSRSSPTAEAASAANLRRGSGDWLAEETSSRGVLSEGDAVSRALLGTGRSRSARSTNDLASQQDTQRRPPGRGRGQSSSPAAAIAAAASALATAAPAASSQDGLAPEASMGPWDEQALHSVRQPLWALGIMLLGSLQVLVEVLVAIPRARSLPPSASLLTPPGLLLWLPALCLITASSLAAAMGLLLPPRWQAMAPWLPAALTAAGRLMATVCSLAAARQLAAAVTESPAAAVTAAEGMEGLMQGWEGTWVTGPQAVLRLAVMTAAPVILEAAMVQPPLRTALLLFEHGLSHLYVLLMYDSVSAAVVWWAFTAGSVVCGNVLAMLMEAVSRGRGWSIILPGC